MILDPKHLEKLEDACTDPIENVSRIDLLELYDAHRVNKFTTLNIPDYWVGTIHEGLTDILERFPNIKFGSITSEKNRLKIYTIPTSRAIEKMTNDLYGRIDALIQVAIDFISEEDPKLLL